MKLLRLTTDRNDGTFDARFNEDIIIPENSSLALQSCALNVDLSELAIDANNNDITITINGNATIIQLEQNTYDHTNFHKLLNDLTTKFNYVLKFCVIKLHRSFIFIFIFSKLSPLGNLKDKLYFTPFIYYIYIFFF